jgi:DUF4097 and DUF4098 domain-containing protein YvlB
MKQLAAAMLLLAGVQSIVLSKETGSGEKTGTRTVILHDGSAREIENGDREGRKSKSFTVTRGGTLDVAVGSGDISISTWDRNEVVVNVQGSDSDEEGDLKITQQGNTVRVSDRGGWSEADVYEISVPVQFNLSLGTSNGDITVRGKIAGNITGETSAGEIRIADVDGAVDMRTSGGDVRTGKINGKGILNTSGGEIEVVSATGELELKSSGGDIRVGNVGKSLRARTAGGDIIIGDVGGEANVATAGGNVRVGKVTGQASLSTAGGNVELNGGNGVIKASTSGGNVTLTNISGSVDAKTSGGNVYAELTPSGKGKSRLSSSAGLIRLLLPENARATITARIHVQGWWRSQKNEYQIRSDFKEQSSSRDEDEEEIVGTYILNGGGETITLETVNSDIEIRKLRK